MATRLFVGGLSWNTDEDGLRQAFSSYGEVIDAKVIRDRESGRSRGFGFVTLADDEAGQRAVTEMNGSAIDGRNIRVNVAEDRRGGGRPGPRRDGPRRDHGRAEPDVVSRSRGGPPRRDYGSPRPPARGYSDGPGGSSERGRFDGPRRDGPRRDGPRRDGPRRDGPRRDGPPQGRWDNRQAPAQDGDGDWASDRSDRRRHRKGKKKKEGEGRFEDGWGGDASSRKKRGGKRGRSTWSDYDDDYSDD